MGQASRPKRTYEETHKTKEERSAEIKNLLKKLSDLEITMKTPGMIDFLKQSKNFIDEAVFWTGNIPLKGTHRVLHGFLTNKRGIVSDITLKYVKEED
jgi:uncharacterized protein YjgD (DUF1641 family)